MRRPPSPSCMRRQSSRQHTPREPLPLIEQTHSMKALTRGALLHGSEALPSGLSLKLRDRLASVKLQEELMVEASHREVSELLADTLSALVPVVPEPLVLIMVRHLILVKEPLVFTLALHIHWVMELLVLTQAYHLSLVRASAVLKAQVLGRLDMARMELGPAVREVAMVVSRVMPVDSCMMKRPSKTSHMTLRI